MQHRIKSSAAAFIAASILVACSQASTPESHEPPAYVAAVEGGELHRLTLTERAAERLDIQTSPVEQMPGGSSSSTVPYSAVMYAPDGETWVYISPKPLMYVRELVVVDRIDGERAVLSDGPPVDTEVVTVGVAELYGTEFEVGH